VRVEEVVGRRVRELRDGKGMTQEQLGLAIGELLGKPWPRQTVSSAEAGRRAFTAVELVAIARALGVYVGSLFTPSLNTPRTGIELSPGVQLDADEVMEALFERMDVAAARQALQQLIRTAQTLDTVRSGIQGNAQFLLDYLAGAGSPAGAPSPTELAQDRALLGPPGRGERSQAVVAAIVTSDRGVLVTRRVDQKPPWGFTAGWGEPGESHEDTIIREVKEEADLRIQVGKYLGERDHPVTGKHMIYYAARPTHGTEIHLGDKGELLEVRWVSLAEADELMKEYGIFGPVREHLARELGEA
jgi:8-oxo-dGTP pyrophosphatase MutT (NUDIX family)/transcriptional regulator with XRE-family HTH domain